ncbi:uncharacterized protein MONOS_11793 [Monocercomonoides exilis]|uniref:uncharacterized protein n=1 Tax=Monocercomonoides exilis TaxID=2049356 RepID=UPI00355AA94D|nr:hypothetical protein MONOS_11793 [Monocercomonoides exilis]|eukprot:MONOS_11793.1-p1 / transcript=MONOS_11793.1 / gene=MONOS_11793 / organism=Monocercomonoides_exilis_PA203 / gene_product=unspecified product / transcript_product=unspecified product / location=Mono_scaffold00612:2769-4169(+) / protein_length=423 / sequence_SO=supercontig / SO=protein_coding / is_pseudo=false
MSACTSDKPQIGLQDISPTTKFLKLFDELENCREDEQMQKILEMNGLIDEMDEEEFISVFTKELYDNIDEMIEEKKLLMVNAILLLKHVGYCKMLKMNALYSFGDSLLSKRMREMIIDENEKKKDEKDERLMIDLCECYLTLGYDFSYELHSICIPCLLNAASNKEENEETQNETEMALLALSKAFIEQELNLNEIKEIIQHHQVHRNLTQLAYQSAWLFLMNRFLYENVEEVITNELHLAREAARELEELTRCVNWKKKDEEKRGKKEKEEILLKRWLDLIDNYIFSYKLWNEEFVQLISSLVKVFKASRDNYKEIEFNYLHLLYISAEKKTVKIEDLLKEGAIDLCSEEMKQSTLNNGVAFDCLNFFLNVSRRLKGKKDDDKEEAKRKAIKRKIFEKMEEEGCEDIMTAFMKFCLVWQIS